MSHRAVCWAAGDRNRGEQCLWKALPPCARKSTPWHVAHMSQHGHHHVALKLQRFGLGGGGAGVPTTFPPRLKQLNNEAACYMRRCVTRDGVLRKRGSYQYILSTMNLDLVSPI